MDLLLELLMDLLFEGSLELSTSRRVPSWIRWPLIVLIGLVFVIGVGAVLLCGVLVIREQVLPGVVLLALGAGLGYFTVRKFRRVYIEKRETWN